MLIGIIFALCAGAFVGVQGIFNRHLNEKVGSWAATAFVLFTGSAAALLVGLIFEGKALFDFDGMKAAYWFFGLVGIGVIFCTMTAMKKIGPTKTIVISVMAQLTASVVFDVTGLLVLPQISLQWTHVVGLLCMFVGIYIFTFERKDKKNIA
jgi:bacterial/archaeal transporter family-2 protein